MVNVKLVTGEVIKFEKKLSKYEYDTNAYVLEIFVKDGKKFYIPTDNVLYWYSDDTMSFS